MENKNKKEALEKLKREMEANADLPLYGAANLVFGEGSEDTAVLFIGEAPGRKEDELRRPFVGQAGKLLDKMLAKINTPREEVYITNIVKRRPPENRDPLPEEIEAYKPYLARQIDIINPKIIATLGRFSMNYFLPDAKISCDHGTVFRMRSRRQLIVPLYHPAAALRAGKVMKELEADFLKLAKVMAQADDLVKEPDKSSNNNVS